MRELTGPTWEDYAWVDATGLSEWGHCATSVVGVGAGEALRRLSAEPRGTATGLDELSRRSFGAWDEWDGASLVVGAVAVGQDVLVLEVNGYLGSLEEPALALGAGTRLASHYRNVNAVDRYLYVEDDRVQLSFEPLFASQRHGADPEAHVALMREVGLEVGGRDEVPQHHTAAAFALAERHTGVRVTEELLRTSTYVLGVAPVP